LAYTDTTPGLLFCFLRLRLSIKKTFQYCAQLALVLVLPLLLLLLVVALVLALVVVVVVLVVVLLLLLRAAIPTRPSSCCAFAPSGLQTTNCIKV
jgi:hypothetical protein